MSSPAKRVLTSDAHNAILASNVPRNDIISDDLTARLQNIGSRVRKSVTEGYNTPPPSAPPSPAKVIAPAKETLQRVFGAVKSTPVSSAGSPLKRSRAAVESDGSSDEDEDVFIVDGPAAPRTMRPLPRRMAASQDVEMEFEFAPTPFAQAQAQTAVPTA